MSTDTTTQDLNAQHAASHVGPLRRAFREVQNASVEMDRMNRPWAYGENAVKATSTHRIRNVYREVQNASVKMDRMNRPWAYQGRGASAAARASR